MNCRFYKRIQWYVFVLLCISGVLQKISAQSKFFLSPGIFYNGGGFSDDVSGIGFIAGMEYAPAKDYWFSIRLNTKYGYYAFNDGTKWRSDKDGNPLPPKNRDEARLKYNLFSPQIGIAPKFHLHFDEPLSIFLENELSVGLMTGSFKYQGIEGKRRFTEPVFCYNLGLGLEYKLEKCIIVGSVAYSTLNFRDKIRKHQPEGYQVWVPDQNAVILFCISLKIPLNGF